MKSDKNILIAFILNILFSVFEFIGGAFTGSVAIISDAVHDLGDALSIGISYFLERKSKKQPDDLYTYGYMRFSVAGGLITTVVLLFGSLAVIYNSVLRFFNPIIINYNGMIGFALVGAIINFVAAYFTKDGTSINQRAVNLHMLEDVLGWLVVLAGAVIMRFTDISVIDPIMSICVSVFILINAIRNLKQVEELFLEKIPDNIELEDLTHHLLEIDGVNDVHHIHVWSIDGYNHYATMHIVSDAPSYEIKKEIRGKLREYGIGHVTLELETSDEYCCEEHCHIEHEERTHNHHHHGHHHHH